MDEHIIEIDQKRNAVVLWSLVRAKRPLLPLDQMTHDGGRPKTVSGWRVDL
jgi:hypothetical protein